MTAFIQAEDTQGEAAPEADEERSFRSIKPVGKLTKGENRQGAAGLQNYVVVLDNGPISGLVEIRRVMGIAGDKQILNESIIERDIDEIGVA